MRHSLSGQIINWAGWTLRRVVPNPLNIVKSCPCEFWFDGQDAATFALNGNRVIQWDDKSGNARHVAQAIDAQRPTYDPATGRLTFVAANTTFLRNTAADFGAVLAQPNTIYILFKVLGVLAETEAVFSSNLNTARHDFFRDLATSTFRLYAGAILADGAIDANDNIHAAEFNGILSNYWINGVNVAAGNVGANAFDGITIGARFDNIIPADAEIMEVFGYNCLLTDGERTALNAYLTSKWGL